MCLFFLFNYLGGVVAYKVVKRALEDVNKSKDLPGEEKKSADINQDGPLESVHSDTTSDE